MTGDGFSGVIAPVLTPFDSDGLPDEEAFVAHAKWLLDDGCAGLAPFGTTSEANSLGIDERLGLLDALVEEGVDPAVLMPGTGTCSVSDTVELTSEALEHGCGGMLMLPPFYYKAIDDEGLFRYFADVIERVGDDRLRVYLYHIPPVAVVGFSLDLIGRLIDEFPGVVVGLKDSSGDWSNTEAILKAFPGFRVFPGSETFLLDGLRAGAVGCISATANVSARAIAEVYDRWQTPAADELQAGISSLRAAMQAYPMVPLLKTLIAHYRNEPDWARVRPPFMPLDEAKAQQAIRELADQYGFAMEFQEAA